MHIANPSYSPTAAADAAAAFPEETRTPPAVGVLASPPATAAASGEAKANAMMPAPTARFTTPPDADASATAGAGAAGPVLTPQRPTVGGGGGAGRSTGDGGGSMRGGISGALFSEDCLLARLSCV